ncbi:MAG: PA14 domain-containing protein [Ferruginibacter sp.]
MLLRISSNYQKEIALTFLSLFFISGFGSLKAEMLMPEGYTGKKYSSGFSYLINENFGNDSLQVSNLGIKKSYASPLFYGETGKEFPVGKPVKDKELKQVKLKMDREQNKTEIGGPGQPEMSSFKSVGSDNMVSPFSGDFSYNLPLFDVGGYPINMFYSSGITMDQDASWVGLGWNINPGTIMRNMRGLPDDFDGSDLITKKQSIRPDKTYGISLGAGAKFAGFPLGLDASGGFSYNNKLGIALEAGIHPSLSISAKAGEDKTAGLSFGAGLNFSSRNGGSITPSIKASFTKNDAEKGSTTASLGASFTYSSRSGITGMHLDAGIDKSKKIAETNEDIPYQVTEVSGSIAALSSGISFVYPTVVPSIKNIFTRRNYNLSLSVGGEVYGLNVHGRINGYYVENKIADEDKETKHPAYGMLYYQRANNDPSALLDFNRANDVMYTPASPAIAMPVYTYDVFSINGEGTGGCFRAYRGDLGNIRDAYVSTKDDSKSLALDLGFGNVVHGGAEFSFAFTPSIAQEWSLGNLAKNVFKFQENQKDYQAVYFKNPGEKAIPDANFQNVIGGENLVRLKLGNIASGTPTLLPKLVAYDANKNKIAEPQLTPSNVIRTARDKRTQVINFLTATEAARVGFDKNIYSYKDPWDTTKVTFAPCGNAGIEQIDRRNPNTANQSPVISKDAYRQDHHISEIDVLGTDGKRYIYGIPVYNTKQLDVSFSVENGDKSTGLSTYQKDIDDTKANTKGRDWFMEEQETPAYTHSFLLTALVSPNYVDVTGNGITEDDMGDAIKFNYSRYSQGFKWRTPLQKNQNNGSIGYASYSEGLKTDEKDDKAHYVYGEREMWHLYSVESKNMVARFYVKNDRKDAREALSKDGGLNDNWGMQRLFKICLFSKADLLKSNNPKPIKTVRFFHSYKLCKNTDGNGGSITGNGKLTLDSIWISYNGHDKKPKSRYAFSYPETAESNPDYSYNSNNRWGDYKPETEPDGNNPPVAVNPGGLSNADYPYVIQDKTKADKYAAAWTLNKIILPSGGVIKVEYESDDYAYVQDKRAASMCQVLGFGSPANPEVNNNNISSAIYYNGTCNGMPCFKNNDYVYLKLPVPIQLTTDKNADNRVLAQRYFEDVKQLYMKLSVTMPPVSGIPGEELIPVYADINKFGLVRPSSGTTSDIAYVQVKLFEEGSTPMTQQVLQFLKQQLPGKAYKGYDLSEEGGVKSVVLAMAGLISSVAGLAIGEDNVIKAAGKCKYIVPAQSFAKLASPNYNKLGGGLRVKKIVIDDNWDIMANQFKATYGQEYKYTTTALINNKLETISSGVASWEPSVGSDENPHREIMRFNNHNKGGPYDYGAIEMPLGEMFYPSPSVGYSRVEVLSIHRDTVKNPPTREVTEFYTTKDFPFKSSCTQLTDPEANVKYSPSPILELLRLDLKRAVTQSQGFMVDMNDMNGKEKRKATYSIQDPVNPFSYTENFYNIEKTKDKTYSFNHEFQTIDKPNGKINTSVIGRDIELMADFREHSTITTTTNINLNLDFFVLGIFPVPLTNILQPTVSEGMTYRSASVLKIVNHFAVLDSVVVSDKGSIVSTKNLVFDAETGNALLTRTNNEHDKPVYNFSYPAHWAYSGMGPAYKNIDLTFSGLTFRHGILETPIDMSFFESGDEMYAFSPNRRGPWGKYPCDGNQCGTVRLTKNTANRIWAVYTGKVGSATPQMVFMDASGNPYTAENVMIRVIRSGHRNMLDQMVGSVTSMKSPVKKNPDNSREIVFKDAGFDAEVIQTSAAIFKDHWRVDNSFYPVVTTVTTPQYASIRRMDFPLLNAARVKAKIGDPDNRVNGVENIELNPISVSARMISQYTPYSYAYDSWMNFDVRNNINASNLGNPAAVVTDARLSLFSHTDQNMILSNINSAGYGHDGYNVVRLVGWRPVVYKNHESSWSHRSLDVLNTVAVMPMLAPWPTNNTQWDQYFRDQNLNLHDWRNFATISSTPDVSNINYTISNSIDTRVSISKNIVQTMINNARTPGNNIACGFRLAQLRSRAGQEVVARGQDRSQCFTGSPVNLPTHSSMTQPFLSVYYYICGEVDNVGGMSLMHSSNTDPLLTGQPIECGQVQQQVVECRSKFTRKAINPYVEGIYGNWRLDTAFVYYGERKESTVNNFDDNSAIDTRTAGAIVNYKDFWKFNQTVPQPANFYLLRNENVADVWQWKSVITQYNRKGYDIENKDPLGRFNAGLYGYNQQLPVAVINNSRVRESMFDGFEDYTYQSALDCISCHPRRSYNFETPVDNNIDATQKHTGLNSLRVDGGQHIVLKAPVTSEAVADRGYTMRIRVDSTSYTETYVTPQGTGFRGLYKEYNHNGDMPGNLNGLLTTNAGTIRPDEAVCMVCNNGRNCSWNYYRGNNLNYGQEISASTLLNIPGNIDEDYFCVKWEGSIQPLKSGPHSFQLIHQDGVRLWVNGALLINRWGKYNYEQNSRTVDINLVAGQLYTIRLDFSHYKEKVRSVFKWKQPCETEYTLIPKAVIYNPTRLADANNTAPSQTFWCTKLDSVNVYDNALTDTFSLVQKPTETTKMLLSAWVKETANDCKCSTYVKNSITVTMNGSSQAVTMRPSGSIIEGWQRYEGEFILPSLQQATVTGINVSLNNEYPNGGSPVFFDDLRIHPFNANMKSFVYHASNLRLMAELDENNYSSLYEYDDDGTLIRVKKETVKGIKTIKETRSATQKNIY